MISPHVFVVAILRRQYPASLRDIDILRHEVEVIGDFAVDARHEARRWGIETRRLARKREEDGYQ